MGNLYILYLSVLSSAIKGYFFSHYTTSQLLAVTLNCLKWHGFLRKMKTVSIQFTFSKACYFFIYSPA